MNQENGWKTAWGKSFQIDTLQPSKILSECNISTSGRALDLGCGNFRNAIYLAANGYKVDAVDIADLHSNFSGIDSNLRESVSYKIIDLNEYQISGAYDIVLACRLFQYLSKEKIESLIDEVYSHLSVGGKFLISMTTGGGIFNRSEIEVPKYRHDIVNIITQLEQRGFTTKTAKGSNINMHVNYTGNIDSYDIEAIKTENFIQNI